MNDACTIFGADKITRHHIGIVVINGQEGIERVIVLIEQVFALKALDNLILLVIMQGFFHQEAARINFSVPSPSCRWAFDLHIVDVFTDSEGNITGKRPGSGRPHQEVNTGFVAQGKTDKDAGVFDIFITLSNFMAAEWRAATRAIRNNLITLIEQFLVPKLLQNPPDALDIIVAEGDVGIVQIYPETNALGELLPIGQITQDTCTAFFVKSGNAIFFNFVLVLEAEFFFDFDFDWQTVCIPAAVRRQ